MLIRTLAVLSLTVASATAAPLELTWTGRLVDSGGEPLNGQVALQLDLCGGASGACTLGSQSLTTNVSDGYVTVTLTPDSSTLQEPEVWIQVTANSAALSPRHKLSSVPYAGVARGVRVSTEAVESDCAGALGEIVFDLTTSSLLVCDGARWVKSGAGVVTFGDATRYSDGTVLESCAAYLDPPAGYPAVADDGLFWIDGDGIGPNAPFTAWCDQTLDGGGWMLLAWATSETNLAHQRVWANYQSSSPTVVPSARGFSNRMSTLPAVFGGAALDVRQTYRQSVDQSTLDITTGTTRVITLDSTFNGALSTTNPLPAGQARHTVDHNCSGYTYIDASGVTTTLDNLGCYVEFTNGHSGNWAACGENAYSSGGAAFNLCFDNAVTTNNMGNSALGLWHYGSMAYHEVYEHNFNGSTAANGAWNSTGGDWTWSAWVRTQ